MRDWPKSGVAEFVMPRGLYLRVDIIGTSMGSIIPIPIGFAMLPMPIAATNAGSDNGFISEFCRTWGCAAVAPGIFAARAALR